MSKRIGELLLERGLIDDDQLQQALDAQLVFGGHLGTCLIEHGFVDETDLGQALAESYGVGYAGPAMLLDVPGPVIDAVPRKVVARHSLIPFRLESGRLHLAMINPRDVQALEQVALVTGFRTQPWVAPEIRVFQAMERYYDIPRRLRFVSLCRDLDHDQPPRRTKKAQPAPAPRQLESSDAEEPSFVLGDEVDPDHALSRSLEDLGSEYGYGRSWREIVGDSEPESTPATPGAASRPVLTAPPPAPKRPGRAAAPPVARSEPSLAVLTLDDATERLCRAESGNQAVSILLDFAVTGTPRCIAWKVDGLSATVWDWRGFTIDEQTRRKLQVQVTAEPLFRLVAGSSCYRGPLPNRAEYHDFFRRLGSHPAPEMLLLPLHLDDRLVALFYGDAGSEAGIEAETEDYRRVLLKFGYALSLITLRQRLRAV
jgi:hypothetical protein